MWNVCQWLSNNHSNNLLIVVNVDECEVPLHRQSICQTILCGTCIVAQHIDGMDDWRLLMVLPRTGETTEYKVLKY